MRKLSLTSALAALILSPAPAYAGDLVVTL
jgi:hypothetical protein